MEKQTFIKQIAQYVKKYAGNYGILVYSPIIAQAILESGWGDTSLAYKYNNYFGLKCGTKWTGPSVNLSTKEEYSPGTLTTINDNFRVYSSMEEGIKGYFEFIQLARYQNLRGITDPQKYLETIKADGYATDSQYVASNMALVRQYNLTQYDGKEVVNMGVSAQDVSNVLEGWMGMSRAAGTHHTIIDTYNSYTPRARGYKVSYSDDYCDTTISAAFIKLGIVGIIGGPECGVEEHVKLFKKKGIWEEDGTITPQFGYIIVYNWDDATQPNDGYSDHIGFVSGVNLANKTMTISEGNMSGGKVGHRYDVPFGWGYIRGYAIPKYEGSSSETGNTGGSTNSGSTNSAGSPNRTPKWVGKVSGDDWNVRSWAGAEFPNIKSWPKLNDGNLVDVCDTLLDTGGNKWYFVRIDGRIYGFVSADAFQDNSTSTSTSKKSTTEVAKEVLAGKYGNGDARRQSLAAEGYNYEEVQAEVNRLVKGKTVDYTAIARRVINGEFGNGEERKRNLEAQGYDYATVQKRVNELL